uniref:Caspase activity and apoptosis inhibitor 1 n=1 Tax=Ciona savignyi TaxID=51511 RepID=H2YIA9_CIOSA
MDQVFKIVKEPKFSAMLPDILKNVPTEELQALCYNKLEVMSTKRLVCVLSGEAMQSSSGTDSSDTENGREAQPKPLTKPKDSSIVQKNFVDSTTSSGCEVLSLLADGSKVEVRSSSDHVVSTSQAEEGSSSDDSANAENGETMSEQQHGEAVVSQSAPDAASDEELEMVEDIVEIEEEADYQDLVDAMLEESLPENKETSVEKDKESELSQLEILELQLRARAIKSLMRNVQSTVDDE